MSSKWPDRLRYALTFRLAAWYAVLFIASVVALFGLTYLLLARSLQARDHDIIRSTLQRYAADYQLGGFEALNRSIGADRVAGRHESLFVRVMGRGAEAIFFNVPGDWGGVDLSRSIGRTIAIRAATMETTAWMNLPSRSGHAMLEVASIRLADGTLFQVGKSSESRDELLRHFRSRALIVLVCVMATALAGGGLLTYGGLRPLRELTATLRTIVTTGRLDTRVPVRDTGDPLDELGGARQRHARSHRDAGRRHARCARQRRARSADAAHAAARASPRPACARRIPRRPARRSRAVSRNPSALRPC